MSRIPTSSRASFPEELGYVWDRLEKQAHGHTMSNVYLAMGNNPAVLLGHQRLGRALWANSGMTNRLRELVLLRCSFLRGCEYEWQHHVRPAVAAGATSEEVSAMATHAGPDHFADAERAVFALADETAAQGFASEETVDTLKRFYPPSAVVGITLAVSFFLMAAAFLRTLDVQLEEPFAGWHGPAA